jgi:mRNA-degrading endonuclease RelE of RelBE toxin-antitoxin system
MRGNGAYWGYKWGAKVDVSGVEQSIAIQILKTFARFAHSEEGNVKRLQGVNPPLYRLRTQDHRVIFRDLGDAIEVTHIRNRREAYR